MNMGGDGDQPNMREASKAIEGTWGAALESLARPREFE
jgi:hypothetical protein